MKRFSMVAGFFLLVYSFGVLAEAGAVYKCRDKTSGRMIFQQSPCGQKNVVGGTDAHQLWREMRQLSTDGRLILSSLGGDVESIRVCQVKMERFGRKVRALKGRVRAVEKRNPHLAKAHVFLGECAVCRSSAESNCIAADRSLVKAVNQLSEYK